MKVGSIASISVLTSIPGLVAVQVQVQLQRLLNRLQVTDLSLTSKVEKIQNVIKPFLLFVNLYLYLSFILVVTAFNKILPSTENCS